MGTVVRLGKEYTLYRYTVGYSPTHNGLVNSHQVFSVHVHSPASDLV